MYVGGCIFSVNKGTFIDIAFMLQSWNICLVELLISGSTGPIWKIISGLNNPVVMENFELYIFTL